MDWLDMWWQRQCAELRRRTQPQPTDGAGWYMAVIDFGKAGLLD